MPARRPAPPPLLRPPRRRIGPVLAAIAFALAGAIGGAVVGLQLRPPPPRPEPQPVAAAEAPAAITVPGPTTGATVLPAPASSDVAALSEQVILLRRMLQQEQDRLDALARARAAAEAQLAGLQREIGAARRDAAAPTPRQEAAAPLPPIAGRAAGGAPRVFMHYRAGSPGAAEAASVLVGLVREGGFDVNESRAVPAVPSQRVVRYFHADDAAAAARLAGRLGRGWAIQDFRGYEPSPSPGTLEVWLPDR